MMKIFLIFIVVVAGLVGAGILYQIVSINADSKKFPPTGQLINVGEHSLHIDCQGSSKITVVMEAGAGGTSLDWSMVAPEIAKTTRVCTYDRAGLGWSESGPLPRTSTQIVSELNLLLEEAGISGSIILVGHSFGGLIAQHYARAYPDDVVGLVLVDAVDSSYLESLSPKQQEQRKQQLSILKAGGVLSRLGIVRLLNTVTFPASMPIEIKDSVAAHSYRAGTSQTIYDETSAFAQSATELKELPIIRQDLPIIVISRFLSENSQPDSDEITPEKSWSDLQSKLARLNGNTTQIISSKSDHYIQFAEPELVINAVLEMVGERSAQ